MSNSANVVSLQQLEHLHQRLLHYRATMEKELDTLMLESRRLDNWVQVEAPDYWLSQRTAAARRLAECKDALTRCQSYVREDEKRQCTDEKKRLQRAHERSSLCEEMLRRAKAAQQHWQREQAKSHTKIQCLRDMIETDLMLAASSLQKDIDALQRYAAVTAPSPGLSMTESPDTVANGTPPDGGAVEAVEPDASKQEPPA